MFTKAHFKLAIKLPYDYIGLPIGGPSDACGHYGLTCPTQIGRSEEMNIDFFIKRKYPQLSATIRFQIMDEHNGQIVCVEVPIKLIK